MRVCVRASVTVPATEMYPLSLSLSLYNRILSLPVSYDTCSNLLCWPRCRDESPDLRRICKLASDERGDRDDGREKNRRG